MSGMVLLAISPLSAAQSCCSWIAILAAILRYQAGGSATLWMHFFGLLDTEVYV